MANVANGRVPSVVPVDVGRLLARADAELVAATSATDPAERFLHAHLGALRAAAAVVALRARPQRRGRARAVWDQLADAEPSLAAWTTYFAGGARVRAALDTGRLDTVDARRADELLACAEDFRDEVAMLVDPAAGFAVLPVPRTVAS
ncbi:SAV_6107 family HEPN domain-containing protein [Cellulosimicrobium marinum]|uniref:SAV_6107 family HEPN domain-containing protein n=1 Tax=Cellulosimicrobium marinum TaxID=1638992 RepID=UPI001E3BE7C8|nr:SAV_6107 family HEPN domain-containing protein [Cellulosimicrobium marinum]MCB7137770.1 colicin transporter [Cellulosimicrobium marinum]